MAECSSVVGVMRRGLCAAGGDDQAGATGMFLARKLNQWLQGLVRNILNIRLMLVGVTNPLRRGQ